MGYGQSERIEASVVVVEGIVTQKGLILGNEASWRTNRRRLE